MIKFILVIMFVIHQPGAGSAQGMRAEFDTSTECEQAKKFSVETLKEYKDVTVISAECKKQVDKTA